MLKKIKSKAIFIILLSFIPIKAFSYELITGLGYGQSNYKGTTSGSVVASLDAYVPLWFDGFKVGIGTSYTAVDLGSSLSLSRNFPVYVPVEDKNVTMGMLPVYLGAKYEYFFNKNFSTFLSGRYGISIANRRYYEGFTLSDKEDENGNKITKRDSLEMWGNMMYGASIGISFLNHYMLSVNYDILKLKNVHHYRFLPLEEEQSEITYAETVSVKLSYAFRK